MYIHIYIYFLSIIITYLSPTHGRTMSRVDSETSHSCGNISKMPAPATAARLSRTTIWCLDVSMVLTGACEAWVSHLSKP